jgi:hypothetical protein
LDNYQTELINVSNFKNKKKLYTIR